MRFYVRYSTVPYEGEEHAVFDCIDDVLALINKHAQNPDFDFDVIQGQRIKFKAVERVKAYEVDEKDY